MPPPHFTPASAAAAAATAPPDLPKSLKGTLKEAVAKVRALLLARTSTQGARSAAFHAIDALLADPALPPAPASGGASSSGGSSSAAASSSASSAAASAAAAGKDGSSSAAATALQRNQIRSYVSNKFNGELLDIFSDEMDQADVLKLSTLVEVLDHLSPLLGPACVVLEWWDVLLRPLLKNPNAKPMAATRARNLVVFAMRATPAAAYQDEPEPSPLWPPKSGGDAPTPPRKKGDTPYPPSSTETTTRKSLERSVSVERNVPGSSGPAARGGGEQFRRFTQRIFDLYTSEASSASIGRREEDEEAADEEEEEREDLDDGGASEMGAVQPIDLVGTTWKGNLEAVLLTFGQDKPKEFFHHLAESFEEPNSRVPILLLLTIFLRINSIHTYHITSTALPRMLVLSAQLDTSTTSTALVITALVILLPHIPNWIANGGAGGLASLLAIYARIVDWRKLGVGWEHRTGSTEEAMNERREKDEEFEEIDRLAKRLNARKELKWKRLESSFDTVASNPPDAVQFFTFVYGIFPCNVIRFLRAPVDYLLKAHFDSPFEGAWEDTLDEPTIQTRSAPVLRRHMLHPALITLSAEKEVSDKQRWKDHDAADITAECISLVLGSWHESYDDEQYLAATTMDRDRGASAASGGARSSRRQSISRFRSRSASDGHGAALSRAEMRGLLEQQQMYSNAQSSSSSSRRESTTAQFSPSRTMRSSDSPSGTRTSADADEILSRYTSLRWGAPLTGTGALRSPEASSRAVTWGATSPFQQHHSTSAGLLTFNQARSGISATTMTPTPSSGGATARATLRKGEVISTPSSPLTGGGRGRGRMRSGSLSSVLSLLPPAESAPLRHSHDHPLASSTLLSATGVHSATASPVLRPARSEVYTELAYLQRENLLLRNELNFELYLKEQHLRHIGRLHRDRIADTALEAERQNLYHTVRTLRAHLNATLATQERQRVEVGTTKARHAAWEGELNAKLKTYREERKVWTNESRELRAALEDANATMAQQAKLLEDAGVELFELRTRVEAEAVKLDAVHEYERKIGQLTAALRYWDDDVRKADAQRKETELLLSRWHEMELYLAASDQEVLRVRDALDVQTARNESLEASLAAAHQRIESLSSAKPSHIPPPASRTTSPRLTAQRSPASLAAAVAAREPPASETQRLRSKVERLEAEMLELRSTLEAQQSLAAYECARKIALKDQREEMEKGVSLLSQDVEVQSLSRKSSNGDEAVQEALKHAEEDIAPIDLGESQAAREEEAQEDTEAKEA